MPHRTSLCIGGHLDGRHDQRLAFPGPGPFGIEAKNKVGNSAAHPRLRPALCRPVCRVSSGCHRRRVDHHHQSVALPRDHQQRHPQGQCTFDHPFRRHSGLPWPLRRRARHRADLPLFEDWRRDSPFPPQSPLPAYPANAAGILHTHAKWALVSRLNTDVQGARTAFTDILSSVVGNLITVLLILGAMFVLSWRITLGALVLLPIFVLPGRFWGRKLQAITRETYDLAGNMNNLMVERFNVAGALLANLFGRPEDDARTFQEKAARVSDISIRLAIYSRLFFTALAVVATVASALAYGWGGV